MLNARVSRWSGSSKLLSFSRAKDYNRLVISQQHCYDIHIYGGEATEALLIIDWNIRQVLQNHPIRHTMHLFPSLYSFHNRIFGEEIKSINHVANELSYILHRKENTLRTRYLTYLVSSHQCSQNTQNAYKAYICWFDYLTSFLVCPTLKPHQHTQYISTENETCMMHVSCFYTTSR